jgi:GAF domain-containing protein
MAIPMPDPRSEAPGGPLRADAGPELAREIAAVALTAASALEVYRTALAQITPAVGASFASLFLRDEEDPGLLRLACALNWPQSSARFLSDFRIRDGRGPTGQAVRHGLPVEVADVFQDPALEDWWEPARELGFVSTTSLPLRSGRLVLGALSFYFREPLDFDDDARALLGVVAHQLAGTAARARRLAGGHSGQGLTGEVGDGAEGSADAAAAPES